MNDINYEWDLSVEETLLPQASEIEQLEAIAASVEDNSEETNLEEDFQLDVSYFDEKEQEDMLWQARTGLNTDTLCGAIETIIFMSDKPISIQKIKAQIDPELPLRVVHESLTRLQAEYEQKHHGVRLAEVAEGYQFRTKATYSKFVQNLFKVNALVLTPTALEVLAIIAYKQPVSKTEIEKIRGVDSSHIIRALMDKRLVRITGRSEELGRPSLFGTTEEFLEVFNLANISALPPEYELEEMATKNTLGQITDIKSVIFKPDAKKFSFDEFEELDQLSENIKNIAAETDFTIILKSEEKKKIEGQPQEGEAPVKRKSAFDILEEFVNRDESVKQNIKASESNTLMNVVDPQVVDISVEGVVYNAPEIDEEFEALRAGQIEELEREQRQDESDLAQELDDLFEGSDLSHEANELSKALDFAFEQLTGEKILPEDELEFDAAVELEGLDFSIDEAITQAKDLDLDLSFLNDVTTEEISKEDA